MFDVTCLDKYGNTVTNLTQWDLNQTLYIEDHGFTTPPQFHFCNIKSEKALVVQSTIGDDDVLEVVVPNLLLIEPYAISVYVYLSENDSSKTVEYVQIPVRPRPQPDTFEYEDNVVLVDVQELANEMRALNEAMSDAEEERVASELNRISNETERQNAETDRKTSETTRISSETERVGAENIRKENEVTRVENEDTRKSAEQTRVDAETERINAENVRKENEANRLSAETERFEAETERIEAETNRANAEAERFEAENIRTDAEDVRVTAENERVSAEAIRQSQEEVRQTNSATAVANAEVATNRANVAAEACEGIIEGTGLVPSTEKGASNGVATLDENSKVPLEQLPDIDAKTLNGKTVNEVGKSGARNLLRYPYNYTTRTISGVDYTDNGDGTVTVNGTATATAAFICRSRSEANGLILKAGTYNVTGCPGGGSLSTYYLQIAKTTNDAFEAIGNEYGEGKTFTLTEDTQIQISVNVTNGATVNNLTFRPMLELGSVAHDYVPYYFGGAENAKKLDGHEAEYFAKNEDLANYLQKSGGTVTGDITQEISKNSAISKYLKNTNRTIREYVGGSGNYKVYDETNGKDIIVSTADGTNTFNGVASGNVPITGGTIEANMANPLRIKRTDEDTLVRLQFDGKSGVLGSLGFLSADKPIFLPSSGSGNKELHHDGNSAKTVVLDTDPGEGATVNYSDGTVVLTK